MVERNPEEFASQAVASPANQFTANRRKNFNYQDQLKQDFNKIFDTLDTLTPLQKEFLKSRWLEQVLWMERRASQARDRYYRLRMITIVGSVLVPALISLSTIPTITPTNTNASQAFLASKNSESILNLAASPKFFGWSAFLISQAVAISAAVEQFFNYGERWRHYRRNSERLKSQGWEFFQLSGVYAPYVNGGHHKAFPLFASQIEEVIRSDVDIFVTEIVQPKSQKQEQDELGEK